MGCLGSRSQRRFQEISEAIPDLDLMTPAKRIAAVGKRRFVGAVAYECQFTLLDDRALDDELGVSQWKYEEKRPCQN